MGLSLSENGRVLPALLILYKTPSGFQMDMTIAPLKYSLFHWEMRKLSPLGFHKSTAIVYIV